MTPTSLFFMTRAGVETELSRHKNRFASEDAFRAACDAVRQRAEGGWYRISTDDADAIIERHIEGERS